MKRNRKWKIPHPVLEWPTLCFSSYKNRKLKVKLWWVGAHERKKMAFFYTVCFVQRNFFVVLSQISYFYISKNITSCTFLLVFKIIESLQFILQIIYFLIIWRKTKVPIYLKNALVCKGTVTKIWELN